MKGRRSESAKPRKIIRRKDNNTCKEMKTPSIHKQNFDTDSETSEQVPDLSPSIPKMEQKPTIENSFSMTQGSNKKPISSKNKKKNDNISPLPENIPIEQKTPLQPKNKLPSNTKKVVRTTPRRKTKTPNHSKSINVTPITKPSQVQIDDQRILTPPNNQRTVIKTPQTQDPKKRILIRKRNPQSKQNTKSFQAQDGLPITFEGVSKGLLVSNIPSDISSCRSVNSSNEFDFYDDFNNSSKQQKNSIPAPPDSPSAIFQRSLTWNNMYKKPALKNSTPILKSDPNDKTIPLYCNGVQIYISAAQCPLDSLQTPILPLYQTQISELLERRHKSLSEAKSDEAKFSQSVYEISEAAFDAINPPSVIYHDKLQLSKSLRKKGLVVSQLLDQGILKVGDVKISLTNSKVIQLKKDKFEITNDDGEYVLISENQDASAKWIQAINNFQKLSFQSLISTLAGDPHPEKHYDFSDDSKSFNNVTSTALLNNVQLVIWLLNSDYAEKGTIIDLYAMRKKISELIRTLVLSEIGNPHIPIKFSSDTVSYETLKVIFKTCEKQWINDFNVNMKTNQCNTIIDFSQLLFISWSYLSPLGKLVIRTILLETLFINSSFSYEVSNDTILVPLRFMGHLFDMPWAKSDFLSVDGLEKECQRFINTIVETVPDIGEENSLESNDKVQSIRSYIEAHQSTLRKQASEWYSLKPEETPLYGTYSANLQFYLKF